MVNYLGDNMKMELDLKGVNISVWWKERYSEPQKVNIMKKKDLKTFSKILKKEGFVFWVEKWIHSYIVYIKGDIVSYSNKESMLINKWGK